MLGSLLFSFISVIPASAQTKFWVLLKDKNGVSFDPQQYFDQKALERRVRQHLPLSDEKDKPVKAEYVAQVATLSDSVTGQSRWLNAVACFATPAQITSLRKLPFVVEVVPMQEKPAVLASVAAEDIKKLKPEDLEILKNQTLSLGASTFRSRNLNGKGVRIAVLDAGFKAVDSSPAFADLRQEKRILKTWDFVKKREYVNDYATHGTMVLSCIAGKLPDPEPGLVSGDLGLATGAEFLLARTERMHAEKFSEEEHWVAAMEWADKNGADIINSSLGYTDNRYFREQMDGKTALVSRAAEIAFEKGMLVVNAAGNDGTEDWKFLGAPADAGHVLTVGGIDPNKYYHVNFSSYGPTADKRRKPNVSAFGMVIAAGPGGLTRTQGTSFASPLVAGFAACAWQANRQLTNVQLFNAIEGSAHLYPYYDYAHGYGMPQAAYFLEDRAGLLTASNNKAPEPTLEFEEHSDQVTIRINPGFMPDDSKVNKNVAALEPGKFRRTNYLYYHIQNPSGVLDKYYVVEVDEDPKPVVIKFSELQKGAKVQAYYKGDTQGYLYTGH